MEEALTIPELCDLICKYSDTSGWNSLARVSKVFSEPALDLIWEQPPQDILFGHLPEPLKTSYETRGSYARIDSKMSTPNPSSQDWDRFRYYAHRVLRLEIDTTTCHSHLWNLIISQAPEYPVFPRVRILELCGSDDGFWACLKAFAAGPSVRVLRLMITQAPDVELVLNPFILTLGQALPLMFEFSLRTNAISQANQLQLRDFAFPVTSWAHLHILRISEVPLSPQALNAISERPGLEELSIYILPSDRIDLPATDKIFRRLQVLSLVSSIANCTSVILALPPAQLWYLRCIVSDATPAECSIFPAIAKQRRLSFLQYADKFPGGEIQPWSMLRCLTPLSNLRTVVFNVNLDLTDSDMEELSKAWNKVEFLIFVRDFLGSQVTLKGLSYLVENMPNLSEFYLPFTAAVLPHGFSGMPNRKITTLPVTQAELNDNIAEGVAQYLLSMLPALNTIDTSGCEPRRVQAWTKVQDIIKQS